MKRLLGEIFKEDKLWKVKGYKITLGFTTKKQATMISKSLN